MKEEIKAVILAAGMGSRLGAHTKKLPKCMVEVFGRSLLDRQLTVLGKGNIKNISLVGGFESEQLKVFNLPIYINNEYSETNMVWSLFSAGELIGHNSLLISYGDIVYSLDILNALMKSQADISIAIDKGWRKYWEARDENPLADAETLRLDLHNNIIEIGKKPIDYSQIEGQYMGLIKLSATGSKIFRDVFDDLNDVGHLNQKDFKKCYMTDFIQEVIDRGFDVKCIPVNGMWVEVDTVRDLENPITKSRLHSIDMDCEK